MIAEAADLKRPRIASAIWLLVWTTITIWTCRTLAMAWPYVQLLPQFLLIVAVPGILFRSADLVCMQIFRLQLRRWWRALARIIALLAGLFAAGGLWSAMDSISMTRFEHAMQPLIGQLHTSPMTSCPSSYVPPSGMMAYFDESNAPRAPASLHYDKQRFVLALGGRSMDIDGSTMFYNSVSRTWRKVHNDTLSVTQELQKLENGLDSCQIALR